MALNQMRAVTNRRIKPNIVSAINAQTPYLPQLYQQKEDTAYKTKLYDQNERSMALNERGLSQAGDIAKRNEALAYKQLDEQKDQNKTAKRLGYANIGMGGLTGLAGLYHATKPMEGFAMTPSLSDVTQDVMPAVSDFDWSDAFAPAVDAGSDFLTSSTPEMSEFSGAVDPSIDFFGGVGDFVTDYVAEPIRQFGGAIWDAGSSFLDDIGGLFS
jgi:hypothetical protein